MTIDRRRRVKLAWVVPLCAVLLLSCADEPILDPIPGGTAEGLGGLGMSVLAEDGVRTRFGDRRSTVVDADNGCAADIACLESTLAPLLGSVADDVQEVDGTLDYTLEVEGRSCRVTFIPGVDVRWESRCADIRYRVADDRFDIWLLETDCAP